MADKDALEKRIEELSKQLEALDRRVDPLAARQERPAPVRPPAVSSAQTASDLAEQEEISEEILTWARKTSLLPRLSTLCFLLVVALVLRTITDNNIINTLVGSALGMGYAVILIAAGWYKYRQESPLAPIFAACGAVLMSVIVVETHSHFQSLPLIPAYMTLMATGVAMAAAVSAVIPAPDAAFSPFATQKSTSYSRRSAGRNSCTARRPGLPKTSPMKRTFTDDP